MTKFQARWKEATANIVAKESQFAALERKLELGDEALAADKDKILALESEAREGLQKIAQTLTMLLHQVEPLVDGEGLQRTPSVSGFSCSSVACGL